MKEHFLKGNFLPAYGDSFGRITRGKPETPALSPRTLAARFRARAISYRMRRGEYLRTFQVGLAAALVLAIGAFNLDIASAPTVELDLADQEVVFMEEILQTQHLVKPPPPPRPPIPVEVPNEEILEDIDLDLDMALDLDAEAALPPPPPPAVREEVAPEPEIFMVVEHMPEMVGGLAALSRELTYPELARKAGLDGVVVVQIIIDEEGRASNPTVIKSVHKVLDDEAVRAVMEQSYVPGRQRSRPVKVAMNIPVTFRLN